MAKKRPLTRNQKILVVTLVVLVISGVVVPFLVRLIPQRTAIDRQEIKKIVEEVIGDYLERQEGIAEESHAESRQLKNELMRALERTIHLAVDEKRRDAAKAFDEVREKHDLRELQELLIKEKDKYRDAIVQRNREIAAVAYLRGDIDIAEVAIDEILGLEPNDLESLNRKGHINRLRGRLKEAEDCYRRMLQLGSDVNDEAVKAVALGNLGLIYKTKGDLVMAEDMLNKSLEINKKLGRLEGMARDYGNLGSVYYMKGDVDKAEEMHKKALEIDEKVDHLEGVARHLANIGLVYEQRGNVPKARKYWEKALGLYKKIGMPREIEKVEGWIEGIGKGKK